MARLLEFWETICQPAFGPPLPAFIEHALFNSSDAVRKAFTAMQAMGAIVEGQKGFFVPRFPPPSPRCPGRRKMASLLRHHAAEGDARSLVRFRPDQFA